MVDPEQNPRKGLPNDRNFQLRTEKAVDDMSDFPRGTYFNAHDRRPDSWVWPAASPPHRPPTGPPSPRAPVPCGDGRPPSRH